MPEEPVDDALQAAPAFHRLLLENDSVRVLDTRIQPGEIVPLHTHCWPAAHYVISWGDFVRRNQAGEVTLDSRKTGVAVMPGQALWSGPLELHTLENVGECAIHIISVEIKSASRL